MSASRARADQGAVDDVAASKPFPTDVILPKSVLGSHPGYAAEPRRLLLGGQEAIFDIQHTVVDLQVTAVSKQSAATASGVFYADACPDPGIR